MSYNLIEHILEEEKKSKLNLLVHLEKYGRCGLSATKNFEYNELSVSSVITDGYLYFEDSFGHKYKVFKFDEIYSMPQIEFM